MSWLGNIKLIQIGLVLGLGLVGWFGVRLVASRIRKELASQGDHRIEDSRIRTLIGAAKHLLSALLFLVILMLTLWIVGVDKAPLWGAIGIVGIAVGLAAQGVARDIIHGLSLLASNDIRVGDKVEIAGKSGVVEEVILRRITLRDENGAMHFVPCGEIRAVTNYSLGCGFLLLEIRVAYSTDIGRAIQTIRDVTEELRAEGDYATVVLGPVEGIGFDQWTDWSVVIKAKVKVAVGRDSEVRHELFRRILARFDREGIRSPQLSMSEPQVRSDLESAQGTAGA